MLKQYIMVTIRRAINYARRNKGVLVSKLLSDILVKGWSKPFLKKTIRSFYKTKEPECWVFMCGCYNSGTTILREIIGAHPDVSSLPREGVVLTDAFPDMEADGWQRMWHHNAAKANITSSEAQSIALIAKRDWAPWWNNKSRLFLEKSIVHTAWMQALEDSFGQTKFIGVVRNGYCVCEGIRRKAKPHGKAKGIIKNDEYSWKDVGQQWVYANRKLMEESKSLKNYHQINYETLVNDPETAIRAIFDFLGVSKDVLSTTQDGDLLIGNRIFKITDENPNSLARLSAEDVNEINSEISGMLKVLGYDV